MIITTSCILISNFKVAKIKTLFQESQFSLSLEHSGAGGGLQRTCINVSRRHDSNIGRFVQRSIYNIFSQRQLCMIRAALSLMLSVFKGGLLGRDILL